MTDKKIADQAKERKDKGLDPIDTTDLPDSEEDNMNENIPTPVRPEVVDPVEVPAEPTIPVPNTDFDDGEDSDNGEIDPWGETNFEFDWNNFIAQPKAEGIERDIEQEGMQNNDF